MSDTAVVNDTAVRPAYDQLKQAIDEIDVQLDSLDDSASAGKRKITNDLVEEHKGVWEGPSSSLVTNLSNIPEDDVLIAVYHGILNTLKEAFDERIQARLKDLVENRPKVEPLINEEQAKELSSARSTMYQQIKVLVQLAKDLDDVDLEMPPMRRGNRGPRGKRALNQMIWSINGEELDKNTTYKELAEMLGFEESTDTRNKRDGTTEEVKVSATANLTRFLKSKGVNTKNPENGQISVRLNDNRLLEGYIPEEDEAEEEDDEEVEEDDE